MNKTNNGGAGFGTAPVFFTAISTILGAILFLRFGYAVGNVGFIGTVFIILLGHCVTIPTAMAIAEIATNQKVEGGGEYFIISRSFGFKIGATIGIALYFSQAISVAFYIIALAEAFDPLLSYYGIEGLDKRFISIPALLLLGIIVLWKGADLGVKALYAVVFVLFISLLSFFLGGAPSDIVVNNVFSNTVENPASFFLVFAICFPAFTGMTAGVGLSGDLKDPSVSIPKGTLAATIFGMIVYFFIAYKLASCATAESLNSNQLIMGSIATWGPIIPIGLACATISSALGSIMVAPRTLQALANDKAFKSQLLDDNLAEGRGKTNDPFNASLVTLVIALLVVSLGNINAVAEIISMFFMVTYGSLCLISFLQHFNADPSYRPIFKSRWYISLIGAILCITLMFLMNFQYAIIALVIIAGLYIWLSNKHKERKGLATLFSGVIFQISRQLQVYLQKSESENTDFKQSNWRPSIVCVDPNSFDRIMAFDLLRFISYKFGFGTYIHYIEGYYSKNTVTESKKVEETLIKQAEESNVFIDTIISPSYTSAIAQMIQLPGISGKANNMILFEYSKLKPDGLQQIVDNVQLVKAGNFDVIILGSAEVGFRQKKSIHIWIKSQDEFNDNLMILLAYILLGHPEWKKSEISIFAAFSEKTMFEESEPLFERIKNGRLPIRANNINLIEQKADQGIKEIINEKSANASLTILGFRSETLKNKESDYFSGYDKVGSILFVSAYNEIEIS